MGTVKGTEVVLRSFQERLKNTLERGQSAEEEGKQPIANLLFQFIKEVIGYLDINVAYVDKFRSNSGSPHSGKMPSSSSSPKVISILGNVDGVSYYCRKGELCEPSEANNASHSPYPRVRVIPISDISEEHALAIIGEVIKGLEFILSSDRNIIPEQCEGFIIKCFMRTDRSPNKWKFYFIEKSKEVSNYNEAIAVFSKGDAAQKKLQRMEEIFIYAGQWISIEKNLSASVSVMDVRIGGITPTDLVIKEQSTIV